MKLTLQVVAQDTGALDFRLVRIQLALDELAHQRVFVGPDNGLLGELAHAPGADRQLAEIRLPQVGKFYKSDLLLKLPDGKERAASQQHPDNGIAECRRDRAERRQQRGQPAGAAQTWAAAGQ